MPLKPPDDDQGPYVLMHGDVWFLERGPSTPGGRAMGLDRRHVGGPHEALAVAFDAVDGALLKHGLEPAVRKWADDFAAKIQASGFKDMIGADPSFLIFLPTEDGLREVNACVNCTGYAMKLYREAMTRAETHPQIPR